MPSSSQRGRRFFIGGVARARPFSENANGKLFKRHVYRHVPSQIYERACLCILRVCASAYACACICVYPLRSAPIPTRYTYLVYAAAFHGSMELPRDDDARAHYHRLRAHYDRRLRRIRIFGASSPISISFYAPGKPRLSHEGRSKLKIPFVVPRRYCNLNTAITIIDPAT